jgi:hypothetical protein
MRPVCCQEVRVWQGRRARTISLGAAVISKRPVIELGRPLSVSAVAPSPKRARTHGRAPHAPCPPALFRLELVPLVLEVHEPRRARVVPAEEVVQRLDVLSGASAREGGKREGRGAHRARRGATAPSSRRTTRPPDGAAGRGSPRSHYSPHQRSFPPLLPGRGRTS